MGLSLLLSVANQADLILDEQPARRIIVEEVGRVVTRETAKSSIARGSRE